MRRFSVLEIERKSSSTRGVRESQCAFQDSLRRGSVLPATLLEVLLLSAVVAGILIVARQLLVPFNTHQNSAITKPIFRISAISDGRHIWVQCGISDTAMIDINTGKASVCLSIPGMSFNNSLVSDDGSVSLVVLEDRNLNIFRRQELVVLDSLPDRRPSLYDLSSNGRTAIRVMNGTLVSGWDLGPDDVRQFEFVLSEPAMRVALDPSGERILVVSARGDYSIYDVQSGRLVKNISTFMPDSSPSTDPEFTPDGLGFVVCVRSTLSMYDLTRGELVWSTDVDRDSIGYQHLAISTDGRWIAASSSTAGICILDRQTGEIKCRFAATNPFNRIAFSPAGDRLYTGSADGSIKVFSIVERRELEPLFKVDR